MTLSSPRISKAISHALRHEPWTYGLELDEEGWARLADLASALRQLGDEWTELDESALVRAVESSPKRRHTVAEDRIRALYGHSIPEKITFASAKPPPRLFHGTSPATVSLIRSAGALRAMSRQYVHLTTERELAVQVGKRKAPVPRIVQVDALAAHRAEVPFYPRSEVVWLAEEVPLAFIHVLRQ